MLPSDHPNRQLSSTSILGLKYCRGSSFYTPCTQEVAVLETCSSRTGTTERAPAKRRLRSRRPKSEVDRLGLTTSAGFNRISFRKWILEARRSRSTSCLSTRTRENLSTQNSTQGELQIWMNRTRRKRGEERWLKHFWK